MRSKIATKILEKVPRSTRDGVRKDVNKMVLHAMLKNAFEAGESFQKAMDNTIKRMQNEKSFKEIDIKVQNFNQWLKEHETQLNDILFK